MKPSEWYAKNESHEKLRGEFATYYGKDVQIIDTHPIGDYILAVIRTVNGEPFYVETSNYATDSRTFGTYEYTLRVNIKYLENIAIEQIPDDLPIPDDPTADAPVEVTDELDADLTRAHLQAVYEGAA